MHFPKDKKILICGVGSIGERHLGNLLDLGYENVILYRQRNYELRNIKKTFPLYSSLGEVLKQSPDVAIITNPTHLHMETAIECARNGCNIFIEKPLADSLENISELRNILNANNKKLMVGYMLRFHPCLMKIKELIDGNEIGKIISLRSQWGEYLPDWHPHEDYRQSYAAKRSMGGGPILTLSHEIDVAYWFLGKTCKVTTERNVVSSLELECEHGADILLKYSNGSTANIHLDYYQRPPSRSLEIIGTEGRIYFDYFNSRVDILFHDEQKSSLIIDMKDKYDRNDMFVDEIKYFFECIQEGKKPIPGLDDGVEVLKIALEARAI